MNTKVDNKYSELIQLFKETTKWHKSRVKYAVSIICVMCNLQTVSFVKFAQGFEGQAIYESNHRRIQRFFADFIIDRHIVSQQNPTGVRHNMFLQILKPGCRFSG